MQMRGLAALPALWLLLSALARLGEARLVPSAMRGDSTTVELADPLCGPLQKHRFRCIDPPQDPAPPSGSLQTESITEVSTSAAAAVGDSDVGIAAAATMPSASKVGTLGDPECGPLEKHRFRCNPPITQIHAKSEARSGAGGHVGDDIEVVATLPFDLTPTSEGDCQDPESGPLEKHRFRCNPPFIPKDNSSVVP